MRQFVDLLRLHAEGLSVPQLAESLGLPRSTVADYLARAADAGVAWPLPEGTDAATLLARLFPPAERPAPRRPRRSGRRSTRSGSARVSPSNCCGSSTSTPIPTATSTPSSARTTGAGAPSSIRSCGRCMRRARKSSWTTPARPCRWWIPPRGRSARRRSSSGRSGPATTSTPRRPGRRPCPTGSAPTSACTPTSAASPRSRSPTISKPASRTRASTSRCSIRPIRTSPRTMGRPSLPTRVVRPRDKAQASHCTPLRLCGAH